MDAGGLTAAEALPGDETVLQFILDAERMRWGGFVLWTGVLPEERVG